MKLLLAGNLILLLDGREVVNESNLIMSGPMSSVADLIFGTAVNPFQLEEIAVGDGSTVPSINDTSLENELIRDLTTSERQGLYSTRFSKIWPPGAVTGQYSESGLFDLSTGPTPGSLFSRLVFPVIDVTVDHQLTAIWTITVSWG